MIKIISKASIKNLKVTPQKLNLVAGLIRNKKVDDAMLQLQFSKKRIAHDVLKCLKSAASNVKDEHVHDILYIKEVLVGKGISMKKFSARARGKSDRVHKIYSHLTILLTNDDAIKKFIANKSIKTNNKETDKVKSINNVSTAKKEVK